MIAYLRREPGSERVAKVLFGKQEYVARALNLCEVFYDFHRAIGEPEAWAAVEDLLRAGVREHTDFGNGFWQAAGKLKAEFRRVSLADCCAAALANSMGATILTADHHEFDALAARKICQVEFFR